MISFNQPGNHTSRIFIANTQKVGIRYLGIIFIVFLIAVAFRPGNRTKNAITTIHFRNMVGDKELVLFDESYTNRFGEPFVVSKFRYYISHLSFTDARNNTVTLTNNYYLVNEADSLSKIIQLPVAGIKTISFWIGVDSARNISGVQTGSLDPMNGMFWTWNSGYIFAKLEGQSDSSHAPAHSFTWDVGGFRSTQNALRKIILSLPNQKADNNNNIVINADILQWFDAVQPLKIAASPVCHQPGKLAMQIADNYSQMFSIAP